MTIDRESAWDAVQRALPALVASVLLFAGCVGSTSTPAPLPTPTHLVEEYITKAEYGEDWPFKGVTAGTLRCHFVYAVVIELDGVEYALNGDARGSGDYRELGRKLLKGYPSRAGTLPLIERGLKLCD
jgi:hypothetical protein